MLKQFILLILVQLALSRLKFPKKRALSTIPQNKDFPIKTSYTKLEIPQLPTQLVYSGYLSTSSTTSSALAFIFYSSQKATSPADLLNYPVIFWFQGGPGSSSMFGNFQEFGPLLINTDDYTSDLIPNPFTWNKDYSLMFVDNPIGTGFSYIDSANNDSPTTTKQASLQFLYAMNQLYTSQNGLFNFLNLQKVPLILAGESYAGKFVPQFASALLGSQDVKFNLKAIMIGDPFTDPQSLVSELGMYGFDLGLIDYQERMKIERYIAQSYLNIEANTPFSLIQAKVNFYNALMGISNAAGGVSVYNFRQFSEIGDIPGESYDMTTYLCNSVDFKTLYGFDPNWQYNSDNSLIFDNFAQDFMAIDTVAIVEKILASIPVLVYQGQNDLIVNPPGTIKWVENLNYAQKDDFYNLNFTIFQYTNQDKTTQMVGYNKTAGNLHYTMINDAGHMIPAEKGEFAYLMVKDFITQVMNSPIQESELIFEQQNGVKHNPSGN